jgi:condensin complex subunit 3
VKSVSIYEFLIDYPPRANQELVEEAFIPTLKTLRNAPLSSPLAEVNAENVAELLIQLTNSKLLLKNQSESESVKVFTGIDQL